MANQRDGRSKSPASGKWGRCALDIAFYGSGYYAWLSRPPSDRLIENAFDEFKTHLQGPRIVLRSRTPELVVQEFYGLLLAHYAVRGLMHEAPLEADLDPDALSLVHTVRVVRRKLPRYVACPPSG